MIADTRGRRLAIRRAENAGASRQRVRAWSAASVDGWPIGPPKIADWDTRAARSGSACERPRRGSDSSALTSSCFVTSQAGSPAGVVTRWIAVLTSSPP
jgi:hypothetical protein